MNTLLEEIFSLPLEERLRIAEDLWDNITQEMDNLPPPTWQLEEVERRRARFQANPTSGRPWEEVEKELRERYGRGDSAS
jgi:putative addiction module component (TIGR02574 family)